MTIEINGTTGISGVNGSATTPAIQGNGDSDTGISFGTDEVNIVTGGTERVTFESTQISTQGIDLTVNSGNVNFTSGFGIDFSDTADGTSTANRSELFADYEEGTWGGTLGQGAASATLTNTKYIKCGRMCWLTGRLTSLVTPNNSGVRIDNVPFTPYNDTVWESTGSCMFDSVNFSSTPVDVTPYVSNGGNIFFYRTFDNAGWSQLTGSEMGTGGSVIFSICYPTA